MKARIKKTGIILSGLLMMGSGMTRHTDISYNGTLLPSRLVFYFGNYADGAFSVRWNRDALLVEETRGGNFPCSPRVVVPGPEHWKSFWKEVEDIGVWSWDESYSNPHGCCGVSYWQLVLEIGARVISCSGEDQFPGGLSPEMTPDFRALVRAIKTLCSK